MYCTEQCFCSWSGIPDQTDIPLLFVIRNGIVSQRSSVSLSPRLSACLRRSQEFARCTASNHLFLGEWLLINRTFKGATTLHVQPIRDWKPIALLSPPSRRLAIYLRFLFRAVHARLAIALSVGRACSFTLLRIFSCDRKRIASKWIAFSRAFVSPTRWWAFSYTGIPTGWRLSFRELKANQFTFRCSNFSPEYRNFISPSNELFSYCCKR